MIRETQRSRGIYGGVVVGIPGLMYYFDLGVINQTLMDTRPQNVSHTQLSFKFREVKVIIVTVTHRSQQPAAARVGEQSFKSPLCGNTGHKHSFVGETSDNLCFFPYHLSLLCKTLTRWTKKRLHTEGKRFIVVSYVANSLSC